MQAAAVASETEYTRSKEYIQSHKIPLSNVVK